MKTHSALIFTLICGVMLASCGQKTPPQSSVPQLPGGDDLGYFCGMIVAEHEGPKSQIVLSGEDKPLWFTSVRDGIAYTLLPEETGNVLALFVTAVDEVDWDHPEQQRQAWINADEAWYVIGSSKRGGMGAAEAIPFAVEAAAQDFAQEFNGRVARLAAIPHDYILGNSEVKADSSELN